MKILLDIDDTSLLYDRESAVWREHPRLKELIAGHEVYLYSGNPDISEYCAKWRTKGYISKWSDTVPKADVLIDNNYDLHVNDVMVKKCYDSIDAFFTSLEKQ